MRASPFLRHGVSAPSRSRTVGTRLQYRSAGGWVRAIRLQLAHYLRPPQYEWQQSASLRAPAAPREARVARVEALLAKGGPTTPEAWRHLAQTSAALYWLLPALTRRTDVVAADRTAVVKALTADCDRAAMAPYDRVHLLVQLARDPAWAPHVHAELEAALRHSAPPGGMARLGEELGAAVRLVFPDPLAAFPWLVDGIRRTTAALRPEHEPWAGSRVKIPWASFATAADLASAMHARKFTDAPNARHAAALTVAEWETLVSLALGVPSPSAGAALTQWMAAAPNALQPILTERCLHLLFVTADSDAAAQAWLALGDAGLGGILSDWRPSPSLVAVLVPSLLRAWPASTGRWRATIAKILCQAAPDKLEFWLDPRLGDWREGIARDPELVAVLCQHPALEVREATLLRLGTPPVRAPALSPAPAPAAAPPASASPRARRP